MNAIHEHNVMNTPWPLEDNSVDCCVTSPPYWALRDYGVAGQLGMEHTPELYVANMVRVFDEVKRVLKPEGTLWLNIGDSYASSATNRSWDQVNGATSKITGGKSQYAGAKTPNKITGDLKPKDLVGIPWMVAFALRSAGWYLRQDIIWHKPNPMPESAQDRCTKAHEYIFLLTKSAKYYYDQDAIKEPASNNTHERQSRAAIGNKSNPDDRKNGIRPRKAIKAPSGWDMGTGSHDGKIGRYPKVKNNESFDLAMKQMPDMRNKRSVWSIAPAAFPDAHFATFPEKLITPCILAGSPKGGLILDPFMGAGTTAMVAKSHGRNYIGLELNPEYIKIAEARLSKAFGMFHT